MLEQIKQPPRNHGITLIEVMIVVAIIAIIAAIASPSFRDMLARNQLNGFTQELQQDLQFARSEAVAKNATITLSSIPTTSSIPPLPDPNQPVVTGYGIFFGSTTIKTVTLPTPISLTAGNADIEPLRGLVTGTGSWTISSTRTSAQLTVRINPIGRVSVCAPTGAWGGHLSC